MTEQQLEKLRRRLLELRDELRRGGTMEVPKARRDEAAVGLDEDEAPLTEMLQVIASNRNKARAGELARVEAALKRLEDAPEDFGLCRLCEEEIALRRLEVMPHVEHCADCQAKRDRPVGPGRRRHLTDYQE
jgi:DnaK suppressor protein